jgi:hypothetical protein
MRQANRRRVHSGTILALMALWLLTGGMVGASADEQSFSNRSLHGAYGEIASGTIAGESAISVARFTFHGDGTCDLVARVNIAAAGSPGPIVATACTYAVQPDGTGTFTTELPGLGTFHTALVIADNEKEVYMITTDPGVSITARLKKQ